jgi:UDP-N-acetylglucosamine 2-epimerase (non-hydrolysing)
MGYSFRNKMIAIFYGTRPEYIKLESLMFELEALDIPFITIQVAQHTDLIDGCQYTYKIDVTAETGNRLNDIVCAVSRFEIPKYVSNVIVQGDTTTGMAAALNAFNSGVPVIHVEAGLRTYDKENPYPEEVNRRLISALADVHYCPTQDDAFNLESESYYDDIIKITGNTSIDRIRHMRPGVKGNEVLITMHRRENLPIMDQWFRAINNLAKELDHLKFVMPAHPNPGVQENLDLLTNVKIIDPLPFETMMEKLRSCAFVITDSGGIQEECSYFKKLCFVCRKVTERPCGVGILCPTPKKLEDSVKRKAHLPVIDEECPFGNGTAGKQIAKDIYKRI